jgi:hypothetical protein
MFQTQQIHNPAFNVPRQGFYVPSGVAMQAEIKTFAAKADQLADQILSQNEPKAYTGPVIIHDHHYYQPWPMFWYDPGPRYVVIHNSPSSPEDRRKNENAAAVVVGIISAIVAGVALYSLGSSMAAYSDANEELHDAYEFQEKLNYSPKNIAQKDQDKIDQASQIAHLKGRICSRIRNSAVSDIILKGALVGAAGTSLIGASATAPVLMTGGMIAGLVTTGGLLFKWGFDSTDKTNMRDAQALKASVSDLNRLN